MLPEKGYETAYRGSKDFSQLEVPTANATGFGAAADDYMERGIDLNEQLISNKPATFFFRMSSEAMQEAGIFPGDVLIVDRSIPARHGKVIIAVVNGEMMVRRLMQQRGKTWLTADNKNISPLSVDAEHELTVWGVVVYAIHTV
ncbi:MAG: translesion error-prone DNA polymerase V autoproteolytic subunit [Chitinophagaceae bacterium]|jgi:DNA polymerase V|nr:translesion error-prone DNA polymerase V autoproteolytic subunit [Chitinophagaceae bacterium]MCA6486473.1 translesion error-prone DNA polymerase V autoproteolytic subunit [Chitinophagaceae bacterium]MCA6490662.1 translesion error-prone DNA polymerase V autoproteolytic subunit [Chitinophagaceae bacterium]MCA6492941.1 translesion error-prone DNA polymerase V autoproteolytic subunit [Chitinophagaceae bacterium]MCA6494013.1 translesion error-prone DNA polymerase V autoproteolytic subunit [Chitin